MLVWHTLDNNQENTLLSAHYFSSLEADSDPKIDLFLFAAGSQYACLSSPCQNGAQCTNDGANYVCTCLSGYTGVNCETSIGK